MSYLDTASVSCIPTQWKRQTSWQREAIAAKPIPIIEYNPTVTSHLFWSGKCRQFSTLAFISLLRKCSQRGEKWSRDFHSRAPGPWPFEPLSTHLCLVVTHTQVHGDSQGRDAGLFRFHCQHKNEKGLMPHLLTCSAQRHMQSPASSFSLEQKLPSLMISLQTLAFPKPFLA